MQITEAQISLHTCAFTVLLFSAGIVIHLAIWSQELICFYVSGVGMIIQQIC